MSSQQAKIESGCLLYLPRDEMAIRAPYWNLVTEKKLVTVFRPGNRLCGDFRSYCPGEIVKLRLLSRVGADWAGLKPEFVKNETYEVVINSQEVIKSSDIDKIDFTGSSPDIKDKTSLLYHLGIIYNMSLDEITEVTRTMFSYR